VGEHYLSRARAPRVIAGLGRGHVTALSRPLRPRQGRLDHQQVGVASDLDQLVAWATIRPVREPSAAVRRAEVDRVGGREVRDLPEAGAERADLDRGAGVVLLEREGALDQVLLAPCADHPTEALAGAARGDQAWASGAVGARIPANRDRLLARRVGEGVG